MTIDIQAYAEQYLELPFEPHQANIRRDRIIDAVRKFGCGMDHVVEIGCGTRPLFIDLKNFGRMTVIEPGKHFFSLAQERAEQSDDAGRIVVVNDRLEDAHDKIDSKASLVIMSALLHEVPDAIRFLESAIQIGLPDCKYLIAVPNAESIHRQLAHRAGLIENLLEPSDLQKELQQPRSFTQSSLTLELESVGLKVEHIETMIFKPFTHQQMQDILDANIVSEDVIYAMCKMDDLFEGLGSEILAIASLKDGGL